MLTRSLAGVYSSHPIGLSDVPRLGSYGGEDSAADISRVRSFIEASFTIAMVRFLTGNVRWRS